MSAVDTVLVVVRLAIGCWLLWSVRRLRHAQHDGTGADLTDVVVVIPARDEAASLPVLLSSLPPGSEVIVVDDESNDDTADVAVDAGARVVQPAPPPPGWVGKSWACAQGVGASERPTVVFVDADVRFGPGALGAVVDELRERGGLVSVQPFHEPGSPVESLASIFNLVGFAGTDAASPLCRRRGPRGAFGPVLATSRVDLAAVGGHEAIRGAVVDDAALARQYRHAGLPVTVYAGGDRVRFRMYPDGFAQLVDGFTRTMVAGAAAARRGTAMLVAAWVTLLVQAAFAPVVAVAFDRSFLAAGALYVAVALQVWWMARRLGRFGPLLALAFPVSVALFLAVFVRSIAAHATGSVSWRGRRVPLRR